MLMGERAKTCSFVSAVLANSRFHIFAQTAQSGTEFLQILIFLVFRTPIFSRAFGALADVLGFTDGGERAKK